MKVGVEHDGAMAFHEKAMHRQMTRMDGVHRVCKDFGINALCFGSRNCPTVRWPAALDAACECVKQRGVCGLGHDGKPGRRQEHALRVLSPGSGARGTSGMPPSQSDPAT